MPDWVIAAERCYTALGTARPRASGLRPQASERDIAAAGAVASRYLAVGTPRSFAIIGDGPLSLEAHRTWFAPTDIRVTRPSPIGRVVPVAEALAADIVCIHEPLALAASQLRRGTHINALAPITLDDDLRRIATIVDHDHGLPALAAGLVDGRQLDEITIFVLSLRPEA